MSNQRGKTLNLTFTMQKIDIAISGLNGECFTPKKISEISGLNRHIVNVILCEKTRKGFLQRVMRGCYHKASKEDLAQKLPTAFAAINVWEILSQSEKPMTHREISEIIKKKIKFNLYFNIGCLLFVWYRKKAIDKIGGKKPYKYQIKADYKDKIRPVASLKF